MDRITSEGGSPTARPDQFWSLIGPRLLESSSLGIIQTLIREDRPLSVDELAERLGLKIELVAEHLAAMVREGSLVRSSSSPGGSSSAGGSLYRLAGQGTAAAAPLASSGCGERAPRLSRAGRDALYNELVVDLAEVSDLERLAESEDPEEIEQCEKIGKRVLNALRMIQDGGIGWGKSGDSDYVELSLPPQELERLVARRLQILTGFVESQRANFERDKREFEEFLCARDACASILDQLRPALARS